MRHLTARSVLVRPRRFSLVGASVVAIATIAMFAGPGVAQPGPEPVKHRVLAADASKRRIAIFDETGKIEWEHPIRQIHDLQLLDNGNILFQETWTKVVEVNRKNETVWTYDAGRQNGNAGKRVEVHAFRRLPDGMTMIAESGPARILEVDRDGRVHATVNLKIDRPHPHRDTRLVRKLQNGNYLVAHEGDGAVREYDANSEVVWEYAVPLFGKERRKGHGLDAWGNQVFCAIRLPNGNSLISTGNGHSVLEVNPEKEIVWHLKQDDLPGIRLAWVTTLEVLPNGNYLIGNCHAGPGNPQIVEITRDKKVVWKFKDFQNLGNSLSNSTLVDAFEDERFYRRKVEPILATNCYSCHGNREKKIRGQLWLRSRVNVVEGSGSGPIVNLVDPEKSRILRFINHETSEHQMPPKTKLAQADIDVLTEWVRRGVPMTVVENEWVYERPSLFTEEARSHWAFQDVVDHQPPQVENDGWCRDELDRFVLAKLAQAKITPNPDADRVSFIRRASYGLLGLPPTKEEIQAFVEDDDPGAHGRLVDRLLASKHYGEHWGRHWLDLVRYADTNGYERDSTKPEAWRYRQYVIDSFNENKPYDRFVTEQLAGDEIPDKDAASITATAFLRLGLWDDEPADRRQAVYDGLDDIVRTTSEVFLGMTMGCARCHDHKLDPVPQADYYSFLSFFHNVRPYSNNRDHILTDVSTPEEKRQMELENERRRKRRGEIHETLAATRLALVEAMKKAGKPIETSDMTDLSFAFYRDSWRKLPDFDMVKAETVGKVPSDLFDIGLATRHSHFGFVFRGRLFVPADGEYEFVLDSDDGARLSLDDKAIITYDGIHGLGAKKRKKLELTKGEHRIKLEYFQGDGGRGLHVAWSGPGFKNRMLSRRNPDQATRRVEQRLLREGKKLLGTRRIGAYFKLKKEFESLERELEGQRVLSVTEHGTRAPQTHVLTRGSAHAPAAKVQPGFPQILTKEQPKITPTAKSTGRRSALAEWLVRKDHRLTARVMVNRVWQYHFGRGLVRSSSDFGMQGRRPTHPKLLDWLAKRFVESGWDIKKLHRRILLSTTYRLASAPNPSARARDPQNDLLWRYDMRRLSAEEMRDSILMVSGQLDLQAFGGPSVYPLIPATVLKGQSRNTWRGNASVENNSRRSIYTFIKRSLIDPFIESFDGATTDTSCPERFQTTQPTQALTLINSGFMHQAAERLAHRLMGAAGADQKNQVALGFELATGRSPTDRQVERSLRFLKTFPGGGDFLALHQFCLIVLNLNEFLFID